MTALAIIAAFATWAAIAYALTRLAERADAREYPLIDPMPAYRVEYAPCAICGRDHGRGDSDADTIAAAE